ncbi:uncharacterized protein LY79DRAFT_551429 [Colletotrichum navitas]|uniref:Uncharacterized protein n=1 Tax=Colletotrichum navitas TaxID=681940 RepID=A0AAD8Q2E5_9PEZI|nr:uncharacterized protein LY79DRAFT_551429 [Colletotrichum navitas]KAK1593624.1 hypothetical protein LY79DRAFT_551429 [Colletotrichum navitas]
MESCLIRPWLQQRRAEYAATRDNYRDGTTRYEKAGLFHFERSTDSIVTCYRMLANQRVVGGLFQRSVIFGLPAELPGTTTICSRVVPTITDGICQTTLLANGTVYVILDNREAVEFASQTPLISYEWKTCFHQQNWNTTAPSKGFRWRRLWVIEKRYTTVQCRLSYYCIAPSALFSRQIRLNYTVMCSQGIVKSLLTSCAQSVGPTVGSFVSDGGHRYSTCLGNLEVGVAHGFYVYLCWDLGERTGSIRRLHASTQAEPLVSFGPVASSLVTCRIERISRTDCS